MKKHITSCPVVGDHRFKRWTKTLAAVDMTKDTGYAFVGEFLDTDRLVELPEGTVVLCYGESGSVKNRKPEVAMKRLLPNDSWQTLYQKDDLNKAWALEVRDDIAYTLRAAYRPAMPSYEQLDEIVKAVIEYRVAGANYVSASKEHGIPETADAGVNWMKAGEALDSLLVKHIPGYCKYCGHGDEPRLTPEGTYEHRGGSKCTASEAFRERCQQTVNEIIDNMFSGLVPEKEAD